MTVRYTRQAERDLAKILDTIAKESPRAHAMLCKRWGEPSGQSSDFRTAAIVPDMVMLWGLQLRPTLISFIGSSMATMLRSSTSGTQRGECGKRSGDRGAQP
jgi:hypothetical protein